MTLHRKRNAMIAIAIIAVLAGGLIAVLSSGGGHGHPKRSASAGGATETQLAAAYLGLTPAQLRRRLRDGVSIEQLARSTPGRSLDGLLHAMTSAKASRLTRAGGGSAALKALRAHALLVATRVRHRGSVAVAAAYLGMPEAGLLAALRSGRTLAQIANARAGHSAAGLIEALVSFKRHRLELARQAGSITAGQERLAESTLQARVKREVEAKLAHPRQRG